MSLPAPVTYITDWSRSKSTASTEASELPASHLTARLPHEDLLLIPRIVFRELVETRAQTGPTIEEGKAMDWQEKYFDKLDRDIGEMKNSLRATEERIAGMINQTLGELRDRDNQRHGEILGMKADMQAIRSDTAETRRWIIGMVIAAIGVALAAIIGVVSIVLSVVGFLGQ